MFHLCRGKISVMHCMHREDRWSPQAPWPHHRPCTDTEISALSVLLAYQVDLLWRALPIDPNSPCQAAHFRLRQKAEANAASPPWKPLSKETRAKQEVSFSLSAAKMVCSTLLHCGYIVSDILALKKVVRLTNGPPLANQIGPFGCEMKSTGSTDQVSMGSRASAVPR